MATYNDEEQKEAMLKELKNATVREEILKPLMTGTFNKRQLMIGEAPIATVCAEYPALRRPDIVSCMLL